MSKTSVSSTAAPQTIQAAHPLLELGPRRRLVLTILLGTLATLGPFTMDLYLPAFPAVLHELGTTEAAVQLTLTATAIGMGVGQVLVGPLSDAFGRRRPLLLATGLHVISSCGVALAPTIATVSLARLGQGLGAAASAVITMAMVRDLFGGSRLVRMLANISLISGLAPIVAPVLGSQLMLVIPWRGVFWALAAYGSALLIASLALIPETLIPGAHVRGARFAALVRMRNVFRDRVFVGVAIAGGMIFGALITYLSTSPFLFQTTLGLSPQRFGLLFGVNAVGLLVATQASARSMRWIEPARLLTGGLCVLVLCGLLLVLLPALGAGFWGIAATCVVFVSACGFCFPCIGVLTLLNHRGQSGTAAAIAGFGNSIVGGVLSPVPGLLGGASPQSLGIVTCATALVALAAVWLIATPRRIPQLARD